MSRIVTFIISGATPGKPRMTQRDKWAQRKPVMMWRAWADSARWAAKEAFGGILPTANQVKNLSWVAYYSPPMSMSKKKRAALIGQPKRTRPDRDNIDKSLLDALFTEDSGICTGTIDKRWDWIARLEVTIELEDDLTALTKGELSHG